MEKMLDEQKLEEMLSKPIEELYEDLGSQLLEEEMGWGIPDPARSIQKGKKWIDENNLKLKRTLCSNPKVISFIKNPNKVSRSEIVTGITDLILGAFGYIPATTISVLLIRKGLNKLCNIK